MAESGRIRLATLMWYLLVSVPLLGVLPWGLDRFLEGPVIWEGNAGQWIGIWLILDGLGLAGWCVHLHNVEGLGSPAPAVSARRLVASGPYRFVRNPMMLGFLLILSGEAAVYQSRILLVYLACVAWAMHLVVRLVEEPRLRRQFGSAYARYAGRVPRWRPRRTDFRRPIS